MTKTVQSSVVKLKHTTNSFIEESNVVHNNVFDYSQTHYKSYHEPVTMICPIHGEFQQGAGRHLNGSSCVKCSYASRGITRRNTAKTFIEAANAVHGDFYDYHRAIYIDSKSPVEIICPKHGSFHQRPNSHTSGGYGCVEYGYSNRSMPSKANVHQFIERAVRVHGQLYDYSTVDYVTVSQKVAITCRIHGTFHQTPNNHISNEQGCPKCVSFRSSRRSIQWINHLRMSLGTSIQAADSLEGEYNIPDTKWYADGFCVETNTIYEFHGDYWHGNPTIYEPMRIHPVIKVPYGELYQRTIDRESKLLALGFNVCSVWESEWVTSLENLPKVEFDNIN